MATTEHTANLSNAFVNFLTNDLVLHQTSPHIPLLSLLRLTATCKALHRLLLTANPASAFPYLDLRHLRQAKLDTSPLDPGTQVFRSERMDEALTEDDFYSGPLRGVCNRLNRPCRRQFDTSAPRIDSDFRPGLDVLRFVQVLVLDGLSVPADLVREIVAEERFSVRILSLRGCTHLNEGKLRQVLDYAVRPGRQDGTPRIKGIYFFGAQDAEGGGVSTIAGQAHGAAQAKGVMGAEGAQIGGEVVVTEKCAVDSEADAWYQGSGRVLRPQNGDWAETLLKCQGLIAFDAVVCRGPRHDPTAGKAYLPPAVATVALGPAGCESCGTCPEGDAVFGRDRESVLPLLAPPPLHASSVKAAQRPDPVIHGNGRTTYPRLILRCEECLRGRWCERCNKWWCESCYVEPISRDAGLRAQDGTLSTGAFSERQLEPDVKVYFNVCVENCLRSEILAVVDGMWG